MPTRAKTSAAVLIPSAILCLVIGVVAVVAGLSSIGFRGLTERQVEQVTRQATERMRLAVLDVLDIPRELADLNAREVRSGRRPLTDPASIEETISYAADQMRAFPVLGAVIFSAPSDDMMWVERDVADDDSIKVAIHRSDAPGTCAEYRVSANGGLERPAMSTFPYVPSSRPYHVTATAADLKGAWTPLYLWASGGDVGATGVGFVRRVESEDGTALGIVGVECTVRGLSEQLGRIKVTPNARMMVLDDKGQLVVADDPELVGAVAGKLIQASSLDDPLVAQMAEEATTLWTTRDAPSDADAGRGPEAMLGRFVGPEGRDWEIEVESLGVDWAPPWRLVVAIPDEDILAGVWQLEGRMAIAGVFVLGVATAGGILLARRIVRPILALRRTSSQIAGGDLEARFEPSGGREFVELSEDLQRMTEEIRQKLEMQGALAVAMEVQQHLLPSTPPAPGDLDIAALSVYSDETGGDYYDFPMDQNAIAEGPDGSVLVAIGDVTGHGIGAALIMATARAAIRTRFQTSGHLGEVLNDVNRVLVRDIPGGRFMTLLALLVDHDGTGFGWASAGHDPPLIYDPSNDGFREPEGGGVPLGIVEEETFDVYRETLPGPGAIVVAATDGVWETVDAEGTFFGKDRLRDVIRSNATRSAEEIARAIVQATHDFRGHDHPSDDVTVVVVRHRDDAATG